MGVDVVGVGVGVEEDTDTDEGVGEEGTGRGGCGLPVVFSCWEKRGGDDGKKAMATMTTMMLHHGVVIAVAGLFLRARSPSNLTEIQSTRETAQGVLHCDDRAGGSGDTGAKETRFSRVVAAQLARAGEGKAF